MAAATQPSTDWHLKENAREHHTSKFSSEELIVRRGQAFTITFNGAERPEQNLIFIAETGPKPSKATKTLATFDISSTASKEGWGAVVQSSSASSVSISISSPHNAVIGRYRLSVQSGSSSPQSLGTFVLLFNPWASGDDVFMPNAAECEEYVLEEFGIIFAGNKNHISSFGWNFGQFQGDILNICLAIMDRSLYYRQDPITDVSHRHDPRYLGRVLSAMVNANDDQGVVLGNWSGKYEGGKNPTSWTGSGEILQSWKKSGFKPVKYGQCWVFAAVLTTVLRCLGIPTRTITNFSSAHDADGNLRVDEFYDAEGNHLERGADSVWNFHVWNESWFVRRDLGSFYDGWQVLDATPQERSKGIYQCGPASTRAIKEGDVDLDYDSPFVFAAVNADCVTWIRYSKKRKERIYSDTRKIGKFISTKAVGTNARVDVTDNYKYPEVKEISFKISYSQYKNSLVDDRKILVTAVCQMKRGASLLVEKDIVLQDPFLTIKVLGPAMVHKPVNVEVTFTNPLCEEVTDCVLRAEGSGLLKEQLRICVERMAPMETSTVEFEIIPYRSGTRQLQVDLVCTHFSDIKGFVMLHVAPTQ
uniref:protein-glutamine gamma-glutamyltransferase n=1 Tax=Junco hyemalis TaxID=40217 RepID=A0A8C5IBH3_JUNHY